MSVLGLYAVTAVVFLGLDAVMLSNVMLPLFQAHIGELLTPDVRLVPAVLFYAGYVAGLVWLVSLPALREGRPVVLPAAVVGAMSYGTYELTSHAIMKGWDVSMVLTDMAWGTVLTAVSAWAGVAAVRRMGLR